MQFLITFIAIIASMALAVYASPSSNVANLFNGESIISSTVGARALLSARNVCSGSALCSNSQGFKDDCHGLEGKIEDTVYRNGGDKSGVCNGYCGLFVQGSYKIGNDNYACSAEGYDLRGALATIRDQGCQTCGWVTTPENDACKIKVDYVSGC